MLTILSPAMLTILLASRCPSTVPRTSITCMSELVLHEGDGWLAVNKPPGMVVHDGPSSLVAALEAAGYPGASPCHRLDAETSGVMLCSLRSDVKARITASLAEPQTVKQYQGVVKGHLSGSGTWDQPISPKAEGRKNPRGVSATRVPAATDYTALGERDHLTMASFVLRSGRTHQIRKHAACNKHAILGDTRYGPATRPVGFNGMALHAARLRIVVDGTTHRFEAPLPTTWDSLIAPFGSLSLPEVDDSALLGATDRAAAGGDGTPRHSGEVASWNRKGYGFIKREGKGLANIYVHQRSIEGTDFRSLLEGEEVVFSVGAMPDGKLEARHVTGPDGRPVVGQPRAAAGPHAMRGPPRERAAAKRTVAKKKANGPLPPGAYAPKKAAS